MKKTFEPTDQFDLVRFGQALQQRFGSAYDVQVPARDLKMNDILVKKSALNTIAFRAVKKKNGTVILYYGRDIGKMSLRVLFYFSILVPPLALVLWLTFFIAKDSEFTNAVTSFVDQQFPGK